MVPYYFVQAALQGARRQGRDVLPILLDAGIPPSRRGPVPPERYARLIRLLIETLGDEFIGLGPAPTKPGTLAMMCRTALHRPDLGGALLRACDFYALFPGAPWLRLTGHRLTLTVGDLFAAECVFVTAHRLAGWAIGRWARPVRATFAFPKPPHGLDLLGCPVSYDQPGTALEFDPADLAAPIVRDEEELDAFLRSVPAALLTFPRERASIGQRVRRILAQSLYGGAPTTEQIAARLHLSPQTLRRRLQAEGITYRRLREEALTQAATDALTRGGQSVSEIAAMLGFSEPSAFHRAFKRWAGTTPGAFRAGR